MAYAELGRGNEAAALQATRASERLLGDGGTHIAKPELAKLYGQLGQMEDAQRLFADISAIAETEEIGAGAWATAYLAIGEYERSLEWLRVAVDKVRNHEPDQGFYNLMHLKTNISSHPVLERSEFVEVRRGLEPEE